MQIDLHFIIYRAAPGAPRTAAAPTPPAGSRPMPPAQALTESGGT